MYPEPTPRGFDSLAHLAGYFDAVEVNSTFYRPMTAKAARGWCRRVTHNPGFRFTAKLWQRFTHEREAAFTAEEVRLAREAPDALAQEGRLGAVLMQFPWSFMREEAVGQTRPHHPLALIASHAATLALSAVRIPAVPGSRTLCTSRPAR